MIAIALLIILEARKEASGRGILKRLAVIILTSNRFDAFSLVEQCGSPIMYTFKVCL